MAYSDKLAAGRDSAWEYIFFAKFWLQSQETPNKAHSLDPVAHTVEEVDPSSPAFYRRALNRLQLCGDPRQIAIMRSLFLAFAQQHLPPGRAAAVVQEQSQALAALCMDNTELLHGLVQEGYHHHWPADMQDHLLKRYIRNK